MKSEIRFIHRFVSARLSGAFLRATAGALCGLALFACAAAPSHAETILGTGTASLLGGDLTDPEDDGDETAYDAPADLGGFDAEFFSSDEPGFMGGEFAFNVFDNTLGPGNDKWCCGTTFPQIVGAKFLQPFFLTHFTVSSANDVPDRDPRVWTIDGSNDGTNWTTIFTQDDPSAQLWTDRLQVIRFDMGTDFPAQATGFTHFRMSTTATVNNFQIGEIEFFGEAEPEGVPGDVNRDDVADLLDFAIIRDNYRTGTTRDVGDLNFNGLVEYGDFQIWKEAVFPAGGAVPEPGTWLLMLSGSALWSMGRRRRI